MKEVFIKLERCTACKSCEIACAVEHSSSKDLFTAIFERPSPLKRVHVEKAFSFSYPARCLHCADAPCIRACPVGAMSRETDIGSVVVNEDRCMGCFMCAMVCPFGAISLNPGKRTALKCDFCGSRLREGRVPACVEACPTQALLFGEVDVLGREKRMITAETVARAMGSIKDEKSGVTPLDLLRKMGGV